MNRTLRIHNRGSHTRAGLAPLELVLTLPLLLMVMALMVVFGHAVYWKVRGATVARHAVWNTRYPRTGQTEPTPHNWHPGGMHRQGGAPLAMLDDPALAHPVVRGPLPNNVIVRNEVLDPSRGARQGNADLQREAAMLPKLGDIKYDLSHPLLDDKFQYPQMGIPANTFRRIPFLYELPKTEAALSQAFGSAVVAAMNAPTAAGMQPLDRDEEAYAWYGYYPNFYPRMATFCSVDRQAIADGPVRRLVGRIKGRMMPQRILGVPDVMTRFFLQMYQSMKSGLQSQIDALQTQIDAGTAPPGAAQQLASLQAQLAGIDAKIQPLLAFKAELDARPDTPD